MKKLFTLTIILTLLLTTYGFSQIKLGVFGGYNMYLGEIAPEGTAGGITFGAKLGYRINNIQLGILTGYFPWYNYENVISGVYNYATGVMVENKFEYSAYSIPIMAYGQMSFSGIYGLFGIGYHFITSSEKDSQGSTVVSDETATFSDLGAALGAGYLIGLGGPLELDLGALFHLIFNDEAPTMLTIHAGVNFGL